jgi:hypothetical protein
MSVYSPADHGKDRDAGQQAGAGFEQVVHPLVFGKAVTNDAAAMEEEVRAEREDAFRALAGDFGVALARTFHGFCRKRSYGTANTSDVRAKWKTAPIERHFQKQPSLLKGCRIENGF